MSTRTSTLAFAMFESLSDVVLANVWGVYVLVLKKPRRRDLMYIGSGTASHRGLRARLYEHEHGVLCPRYVADAQRAVCRTYHKALLAYCSNIPVYRTVIVAVEAALSAVF
ncbi:hypothetical protein K505DRAFT_365742 [Melanomma pulvis-pyrius CBS 109.77]|uniref:GIY-YIG domain-containing protein n=1 Tax=Melanomma pulvis-pyrius CBS 109.77 TaxID=1314802 RepID=A0A6A6WZB4_9PLEO|nr:hypothetical protein K505DRAFT_365742 [Melanomma pulvis-pyrius CBS 109.77]